MKPYYWHQKGPDSDDSVLREMIAKGVVPKGCLWGGEMVRFAKHELQEDPCAVCKCPDRPRCGGRPAIARAETKGGEDLSVGTEGVAARRLERAGYIRDILGMLQAED